MQKIEAFLNWIMCTLYTILPLFVLYIYVFKLDDLGKGFESYIAFTNTILVIAVCYMIANGYREKIK